MLAVYILPAFATLLSLILEVDTMIGEFWGFPMFSCLSFKPDILLGSKVAERVVATLIQNKNEQI